jgi:hypothetical protein
VLLALTVTCHLIPAVFAIVGAAVILAFEIEWTLVGVVGGALALVVLGAGLLLLGLLPAWLQFVVLVAIAAAVVTNWRRRETVLSLLGRNRLRLWWFASALGTGAVLTTFWTLPFYANRRYMTDMGWEKLHNYLQQLFPGRIGDRLAHMWNGVNGLLGGHSHHVVDGAVKMGSSDIPADMTWVIALAAVGVGTSIAFRRRFGLWLTATAGALAVLVAVAPQGRLWNARLLPFWYLVLYFLAGIAIVELLSALAVLATRDGRPSRAVLLGGPVAASLVTAVIVAFPLWSLPGGHASASGRYSWLGFSTTDHSFVPSWAKWNYRGYEKKDAYPEYYDVVTTMARVGQQQGCGRAMWEYEPQLDRFGTPMALMLLPYWTDGCIGSMEGLYFEASATTPYHFLNQSELSTTPSRAQRDLPYGPLDVDRGVAHLQLLGVRYYMAFSEAAVAQAKVDTNLTEVATTGKWHVYEVKGADLVQPLTNLPAVVKGADAGGRTWQDMAVDWYVDPARWGVLRAAGGPKGWQRISEHEAPVATPVRAVTVSHIAASADRIRFHVDRPGVPVLVKTSYFPNWKASNAKGPYRVAPNLMVVIPTGTDVTLHYGRTSVDWLAILLTVGGVAIAVVLSRRRLAVPPRPTDEDEDEVADEGWPSAPE